MKCANCKRDINRGTEMAKSITEYRQADGTIKTYGWDRPDGPWQGRDAKTEGKLMAGYHYKCYRVAEKRETRGGDAVKGRGMGNVPDAYDIAFMTANQDELKLLGITEEEARARSTQFLSDRVQTQRHAAVQDGTGTDNWATKEQWRATEAGATPGEHGSFYYHSHRFPNMDRFKMVPHLLYAHDYVAAHDQTREDLIQVHHELHLKMTAEREQAAREAQAATMASRANDPGYQPIKESDWRDQAVVEVGEVKEDKLQSSGEELSLSDLGLGTTEP